MLPVNLATGFQLDLFDPRKIGATPPYDGKTPSVGMRAEPSQFAHDTDRHPIGRFNRELFIQIDDHKKVEGIFVEPPHQAIVRRLRVCRASTALDLNSGAIG